jgi:FSR family fosmidomycin resistance protein-like MFS transporter
VLHDGFSELLFVLFPIWKIAFGLSFAQVALLKMLYSGSIVVLPVPASLLAEHFGVQAPGFGQAYARYVYA